MCTFERGGVVGDARPWAIALLLAFTTPAAGQTADRPRVQAGDRWQFVMYYGLPSTIPNRTWIVDNVTATRIEGTENGEPLRLTPDMNVLDSPRQRESNPRLLDFPLEVGKRWSYRSEWLTKDSGSRGVADVAVAVAGHEKVRVPAGEFDAFRIEATSRFRGKSTVGGVVEGESDIVLWYAPAARVVVKSVARNPYRGTSTVELVEFALQP